jgi:hypothetical protein
MFMGVVRFFFFFLQQHKHAMKDNRTAKATTPITTPAITGPICFGDDNDFVPSLELELPSDPLLFLGAGGDGDDRDAGDDSPPPLADEGELLDDFGGEFDDVVCDEGGVEDGGDDSEDEDGGDCMELLDDDDGGGEDSGAEAIYLLVPLWRGLHRTPFFYLDTAIYIMLFLIRWVG